MSLIRNGRDWALLALVDWEAEVARLSTDEAWSLDEAAAAMAVHCARLSAYLSRRRTGGRHTVAVKHQNQVARKVRQALGFMYGDDSITF